MSENLWIGFDLDGTLHDMARVQLVADRAVFNEIAKMCEQSAEDLRTIYHAVNETYLNPDFFANGMGAHETRALRYRTFLDHIDLNHDALVEGCIEIFLRPLSAMPFCFQAWIMYFNL